MEEACYVDWRDPGTTPARAERVYFGHETCQHRLPSADRARELASVVAARGLAITLVTPPLTDDGLVEVRQLIESLRDTGLCFEVVCNDWGLLSALGNVRGLSPVAGRLLSGQRTDPRLRRALDWNAGLAQRTVRHLDGSHCVVRHRPPSPQLRSHYRSCPLDRTSIIEFLGSRGVCRCELSNVAHGLDLNSTPGWSYSLHVPEVLLAVMRGCPGEGEDFSTRRGCCPGNCDTNVVPWRTGAFPVDLFRRGNALYYHHSTPPKNLAALPIDRIVRSLL